MSAVVKVEGTGGRYSVNLFSIQLGDKQPTEWIPVPIDVVKNTSLDTKEPRYFTGPKTTPDAVDLEIGDGGSSSSSSDGQSPPAEKKKVVFCPVVHPDAARFGDINLWPGQTANSMKLKGRPYSGRLLEDGIGGVINAEHLDNFITTISLQHSEAILDAITKYKTMVMQYMKQKELNEEEARKKSANDNQKTQFLDPKTGRVVSIKPLANPYMGPVFDSDESKMEMCNQKIETLSDLDNFLASQNQTDEEETPAVVKDEGCSNSSSSSNNSSSNTSSLVPVPEDGSRVGIDADGNLFVIPPPNKKERREIEKFKKDQAVADKEIECLLGDKPDNEQYNQQRKNAEQEVVAELIEAFFLQRCGAMCPIALNQKEVTLKSVCVLTKDMFRLDKRKDARRILAEQWQPSSFVPHIPVNELYLLQSQLDAWNKTSILQIIRPLDGKQLSNRIEEVRTEMNDPKLWRKDTETPDVVRVDAQKPEFVWLGGVERVHFLIPESEI
jgi:hypothetical protein